MQSPRREREVPRADDRVGRNLKAAALGRGAGQGRAPSCPFWSGPDLPQVNSLHWLPGPAQLAFFCSSACALPALSASLPVCLFPTLSLCLPLYLSLLLSIKPPSPSLPAPRPRPVRPCLSPSQISLASCYFQSSLGVLPVGPTSQQEPDTGLGGGGTDGVSTKLGT